MDRDEDSSPQMWLGEGGRHNDANNSYHIHPPARKTYWQKYKQPATLLILVVAIVTVVMVAARPSSVTLMPPPHAVSHTKGLLDKKQTAAAHTNHDVPGRLIQKQGEDQSHRTAFPQRHDVATDSKQQGASDLYSSSTAVVNGEEHHPDAGDLHSNDASTVTRSNVISTPAELVSGGAVESLVKEEGMQPAVSAEAHQQWLSVQAQRRLQLKQACEKRGKRRWFPKTKTMLVDPAHKVIMCTIPKAGCTSWKWLLIQLQDDPAAQKLYLKETQSEKFFPGLVHKSGYLKKFGLVKLMKLSSREAKHAMKFYTKIIAVRDPLERMLSGYSDKLVPHEDGHCPFCQHLGRDIIKYYRKDGPKDKSGRSTTAVEFLEALVGNKNKVNINGGHWATYESLCHPCEMEYDYISHLETSDEDSDNLIQWVFNSTLRLPHHNPSNSSSKSTDVLRTISPTLKQKILGSYGFDMDMFGYTWPD